MPNLVSRPRILSAAIALAIAFPAGARTVAAQTRTRPAANVASTASTAAAERSIDVPEGTEFYVVTTEPISSKSASQGQRVALTVDENVLVNGQLVIAKGTPVRAEVGEVKGAGMLGKAGKLSLRIESTSAVDGHKVPLRGNKTSEGKGRAGTMVAVAVLVSPVGLLIKGKNVTYPEGTRLSVYTDEVVSVTVPSAK